MSAEQEKTTGKDPGPGRSGSGRRTERILIAGIVAAAVVSVALLGGLVYFVFGGANEPPQTAVQRDVLVAETDARNSPKSAAAQLAAGWANLVAEDYDEALSYADRTLQLEEGAIDALVLKGLVSEAKGDLGKARALLLEAGEANREGSIEAYSRLASLEQRQGDLELAVEYLTRATTLAPTDAQLKVDLARLNAATGDKEAARQNLILALQYLPDEPQLRDEFAALSYGPADYDMARLAFAEGRPEEAETLMRLAVEHSPDIAWLQVALGDFLLDIKNDPAGAEQAYNQALEIDPDNEEARAALESL